MADLLYDVVEDINVTLEDLENKYKPAYKYLKK